MILCGIAGSLTVLPIISVKVRDTGLQVTPAGLLSFYGFKQGFEIALAE